MSVLYNPDGDITTAVGSIGAGPPLMASLTLRP
jgi:hypothetical protein